MVFVSDIIELLVCGMLLMLRKVNIGIKMISGVISCIIFIFKFFNSLLILRAFFCLVFGKKKLILFMFEVKFVFVKLYSKVIMINILKGVFGFCTVISS